MNYEHNEDFELEFTLEEELILTEGVKDLLKELKKWFDEKKAIVKEKIRDLRNREDNKSEAMKALDDALDGCSEGIKAVQQRDTEKATGCKEKVIKALKAAGLILAGSLAAYSAYDAGHDKGIKKGNQEGIDKHRHDLRQAEGRKKAAAERQTYMMHKKLNIGQFKEEEEIDLECMISEDVKGAIKAIKDWFKDKIDMVKEKFKEFKGKISKKLAKLSGKEKQELENKLDEAEDICNDIVRDCKQGISAANSNNMDKAQGLQEKIKKGLKVFAGIVAGSAAVLGGSYAAGYAKGHKQGKVIGDDFGKRQVSDTNKAADTLIGVGDYWRDVKM